MKVGIRACLFGILTAFGVIAGGPSAKAGAPTAIFPIPGGFYGSGPTSNLVADPAGNLYGVTYDGGGSNYGTVFELSPPIPPSTAWTETLLHVFAGFDGRYPQGGLARDAAGNLYGTAGSVFKLSPPAQGSTAWTFTVIGGASLTGGYAFEGRMILDGSGNLYGTTENSGLKPSCCNGGKYVPACCGVVFKLSPPAGGTGPWTETVLHTFKNSDGNEPQTDLVFDGSGNLYGVAPYGGGSSAVCGKLGCGVAFELSPPVRGSSAWTEKTIYHFVGGASGSTPITVTYQNGKLYGPADAGGSQGQGALFVLTLAKNKWSEAADSLTGYAGTESSELWVPPGSLVTDPAVSGGATFYGVTFRGGSTGNGTVFSWTP